MQLVLDGPHVFWASWAALDRQSRATQRRQQIVDSGREVDGLSDITYRYSHRHRCICMVWDGYIYMHVLAQALRQMKLRIHIRLDSAHRSCADSIT